MSTCQVQKTYMKSLLLSAGAYAGTLIGVTFVVNKIEASPLVAGGLAIIPAVFILLMLRAVWIYVHDVDEAQRFFLLKSMMVGLFSLLALSGSWGLVEMMSDDLPRLPIFWLFPLFFGVFGLSTCFGPGRGMGQR